MKKKLYIIDGNSYIHRAYHAIRNLRTTQNFPTNAIYGFTNMLLKILSENPDYIVVVFDAAKKSFRNDIYPEYKANRPPMEKELVEQLPYIRKIVEAFNIPVIIEEGVEADDAIASLVNMFKNEMEIIVISSDKDLTQLLDENIIMWDTLKDVKYTVNNIKDKFGVPKEYIIDYLALVGDASDNIPGVKGIGPKTAVKLINEFGHIENIYKNLEQIKSKRIKNLLKDNKDKAFLSKALIKLKDNINLFNNKDMFIVKSPDYAKLKKLFSELEFTSFLKRFNLEDEASYFSYNIVKNKPANEKISGIIIEYRDNFFKEVTGAITDNGKDVFILKSFEDLHFLKNKMFITQNFKELLKISEEIKEFEDVGLIAYIFDPEQKTDIEHITKIFLKKTIKSIDEYKKKKNEKIYFEKLGINEREEFLATRCCALWELYNYFMANFDDKLKFLYYNIEKPLIAVLHRMEKFGIYINREVLEELNKQITIDIESLVEKIYNVSGEQFNINSPIQLRNILFNKLQLNIIKKTKTGPSTDNEVLEILSKEHILPELILEYREKNKIKTTYLEGLLPLINRETSRIYPTFNQMITATGRLSCTHPNIQNIPVRTEYGDRIRQAFSAPEGRLLVSFDYSQIELRLMAHFSEDEELIKAFKNNIDVHSLTASKIYKVALEQVDENMRRDGKTVNFAIIYGITPHGLAKSLKVSRDKAKKFIDNYFEEYKGVKNFIDKFIKDAEEKGFVETLYKRRRFIRGIKSKNFQEREFSKRVAVNTPIQGTAADIIKIAMLELDKIQNSFNANMIMQIHDELIFEVNEENAEKFASFAKDIMENISPEIKVPLKVDVGIGKNWFEAH